MRVVPEMQVLEQNGPGILGAPGPYFTQKTVWLGGAYLSTYFQVSWPVGPPAPLKEFHFRGWLALKKGDAPDMRMIYRKRGEQKNPGPERGRGFVAGGVPTPLSCLSFPQATELRYALPVRGGSGPAFPRTLQLPGSVHPHGTTTEGVA